MSGSRPRYPVYVPTRDRYTTPYTIRLLQKAGVPFRAVVVPSEVAHYEPLVGEASLLVLPSDEYVLRDSRNWIKDHATDEGWERHWQLDDNVNYFSRLWAGKRVQCNAGLALRVCEDFTDRYENIAISGLAYEFFVAPDTKHPFRVNVHVYSCTLVNNAIPHRWRLVYNDDTDMCLQVLADEWNTILVNAFTLRKMQTMHVSGGNTDQLYQGDGRLKMARALERAWPGVVRVDRRYGRPQHVIEWGRFRRPLVRKADAPAAVDYGMRVVERRPVTSPALRRKFGLPEPE